MLSFIASTIIILLGLIIFINCIVTLFSFLFLYIDHNLAAKKNPNITPIKLTTLFTTYLLEIFYVNTYYLLWPLKFRRMYKNIAATTENSTTLPSAPDTMIVLVHGYGRAQTDWLWFQHQLAKSISAPICAFNLSPTMGSMQEIATILQTKLKSLQTETKCKKMILVGHSMGGLVCSYLSEFLDDDNYIEKVILIGSPLHGTKLALLGYGINSRQMEPDAKFLTSLLAKMQVSKKLYFYVASKIDNMIIPWSSCLPRADLPANQQLITKQLSHQGLIHSREVLTKITQWVA